MRDTVCTPHMSGNIMIHYEKNRSGWEREFFDDGKSAQIDSRLLCEHVFNRLRLPDYEDLGQANTMFMPRLSGNK